MRFVADRTLGKLARKLRILGFDTLYWRGGDLSGALQTALSESRVLLTRSRKIREIPKGLMVVVVEANDPGDQTREVIGKLHLQTKTDQLFRRCLLCNEELQSLLKEDAEGKVPDFIYQSYDIFHMCPRCRRIYWPGTHYERMQKEMAGVIKEGSKE